MLPEGTWVKNSGGRYTDELRPKLPLVNEAPRKWDSGDLVTAKVPSKHCGSFDLLIKGMQAEMN